MQRLPPTIPFEERGPFGGLMELPSPKHIPANRLVSASNVQQRGGRISPRPGFERARDGAFLNVTTLKANNSCQYLSLDTTPAPDRLYYTYGTKVARVDIDGTSPSDLYTGLTNPTAILLDVSGAIGAASTMYFCDGDFIVRSAPFVPGATSSFLDLTASGYSNPASIAFNSTTSKLWFGVTKTSDSLPYLLRYSTAPTLETSVVIGSTTSVNMFGIAIDATNANMFTATSDGTIRRHNATTGAIVATPYTGLTGLRDIKLDTTQNRLYWSQQTAGGNKISYGSYTAATGAVTGNTTLVSFDDTIEPKGLAIDAAGNVVYGCNSDSASGSVFKVASDTTIVSSFYWRRSLLGSTSSEFTDDLMLLQFLDPSAGGSDFYVYFPSRSSAPDDLLAMTPGYTAGASSNPDRFVMISRTANPGGTDPITPVGNYGRASFAYTSRGFDTSKGGVLMAASSGAYVFNYFTGDTAAVNEVQTVTVYGAPSGAGTYQLTLGTTATANINEDDSAATVDTAITNAIATDTVGATVDVTRTGSGTSAAPYVYTVTFTGTLAGIGLPLLRCTTNGLTGGAAPQVLVERTTRGSSHTNGILYLRPAGLPRPSAPTCTTNALSGANLQGIYEYVITFYSSTWDIESPPSAATELDASAAASYTTIDWTVPSTLYFNNYFSATSIKGGPLIDFIRIYRKKTGSALSGGEANGVGAQLDFYFVAQVQANLGVDYRDNVSDASQTADIAPAVNEYPPSDSQFVTVLDGVAYYAGISPNNKTVWNSEKTKLGGITDGELGYEYVANTSFTEAFDDTASDHHITGLSKLGGQLVVGTDERLLAADTSQVDIIGLIFRAVPGAAGMASHWCVTETLPLIGDEISGALLLYANPKGGMYAFDGARAQPIARDDIATTNLTFSPKTWQDVELGFGSITSWYWATTVLDPDNNRILMAAPLAAGGTTCMVYDLDTKAWLPWSINKLAWALGREWDDALSTLGRPVLVCFDGSSIFKLVDGADDDGASFTWSAKTGFLSLGTNQVKRIKGVTALFDLVSFSGSSGSATLKAFYDDLTTENATSGSVTLGDTAKPAIHRRIIELGCDGIARHVQLEISGTQSNDYTHPALVGYTIDFEVEGR